jgi:hypothetical protein
MGATAVNVLPRLAPGIQELIKRKDDRQASEPAGFCLGEIEKNDGRQAVTPEQSGAFGLFRRKGRRRGQLDQGSTRSYALRWQ